MQFKERSEKLNKRSADQKMPMKGLLYFMQKTGCIYEDFREKYIL